MPRTDAERGRKYMHDWYVRNRARIIARSTAYNKKHRARRLGRYRDLYAARYRKRRLMKLYNLTSAEFDRLDQITTCQICGQDKPLVYDHDHATGRVRGRLCHTCNLALGLFGDREDLIFQVYNYLMGEGT